MKSASLLPANPKPDQNRRTLKAHAAALESELWIRRQDRRDETAAAHLTPDDHSLAPLITVLARLAAQRDAKVLVTFAEKTDA